MISKQIKEKGIFAKLLEKGIALILKKECKYIGKIKIDIIASSLQIINGIIENIYIIAEEINYKDLLFDKIELEGNDIKIKFKINNKELKFKNNPMIKFKITLSENSLKAILLSNNWNWIGDKISKGILNEDALEDIKIKNDQFIIITSKCNETIPTKERVNIKTNNGNLYLENQSYNKSIKIPIEEKVFINNVNIKNNLINIFAKSSISF